MKKHLFLILGLSLTSGCYEPSDFQPPFPSSGPVTTVEVPLTGQISGQLEGCWEIVVEHGPHLERFDKVDENKYHHVVINYGMVIGGVENVSRDGNKLTFYFDSDKNFHTARIKILTENTLGLVSTNEGKQAAGSAAVGTSVQNYKKIDASKCSL